MRRYLLPFFSVALVAGYSPDALAYQVYPVPQNMALADSRTTLPDVINIVASDAVGQIVIDRAAEVLERNGFTVTYSSTPGPGTDLIVGINGSGDEADRRTSSTVFSGGDHHFDPHVVMLNSDNDFVVLGDADGSAFYGMATLEQILEQRSSDGELSPFVVEDYSHTRYRGVVEGFYGHPFTVESREEMFEYFKRYKLNYYLYAPKSDPYHTGMWRDAYPETVTDAERNLGRISAADLRHLTEKAHECNIDLVWACHPALHNGINFNDLTTGVADIMSKFQMMYDLGFRHFGVSVDDMSGHPSRQWELGDKVQKAVDQRWNTDGAAAADRVGHVVFVPTQYALNYGTYTLTAFKDADPNLELAFTGYDCFSNVRPSSFAQMAGLIGRDPIFWWNNPVNDDYDEFLYMHGLGVRWFFEDTTPIQNIKGFLLNPMNQGQASKICYFSAADYAWNPKSFDENSSWEAAVASLGHTQEMTDALKAFIRCMSAYTTRDTRTPEGEEFAPLYQACQTAVSNGVTTGFDELHARMVETRDACRKLREMETSEYLDQQLLYIDILPWLNKVEEMSSLVAASLELLSGEATLANWAEYQDLETRAAAIHTDARYQHSVLEGSGTSSYEVWREVQPTPKYMDSFVSFITSKAAGKLPELPQRDRTPEVISNFTDELPNCVSVNYSDDKLTLTLGGLDGVELDYHCYVGLNINRYVEAGIPDLSGLPDSICAEVSVNGKHWVALDSVITDDNMCDMAYFRLYNPGDSSVTLGISELSFSMPLISNDITPVVTTNMSQYSTYFIANVIDGDPDTFFWKDSEQAVGDYVQIDLGDVAAIGSVTLQFRDSDQPTGQAAIQLSDDALSWTDLADFTSKDIVGNTISFNGNGASARYVRLYLKSVGSGYWFQLAEFSVESASSSALAVAFDSEDNGISVVDDRKLSTSYTPSKSGWMIYRFTENIFVESVNIFHSSKFADAAAKPEVLLAENDGVWLKLGELDAPCTVLEVDTVLKPAMLKIIWNDENIPSISEIIPMGEHYYEAKPVRPVKPVDPIDPPVVDPPITSIDGVAGDAELVLYCEGTVLHVACSDVITSLKLYSVSGALVNSVAAGSKTCTVELPAGHTVLVVETASGKRYVQKL